MDDELTAPMTAAPEELFADLREQTAVTLLSEGLLRFSDPGLASTDVGEDLESEPLAAAAD